jgi:glycosyltransferase involved in cell wall biosynthesis
LLSAYRADSHASWADWLCENITQVKWHRLELPGRHFRWRIRGNPLSWLDKLPETLPDLILATSMVDLATIKGLHPALADIPSIYYFHENQFAYPAAENQIRSIEPQMVQLYGALAADRLLFNSQYNLDSFLTGVDVLLDSMPDEVPHDINRRLLHKAEVLAVPVTPIPASNDKDEKLIVWNHRWEYDKAPELFTEAMLLLAERGIEFRLALLGARPRQTPAALKMLREKLADKIIIDEKAELTIYRDTLSRASIVISTSIHEFQGIAIMEAVSAGARPLVPDSLCYPA